MKGSKMFGKSILVIALSLVLIISAVAPLTVMGSENYGGGSKGTSLGQYRYYSVKSGDTLASIASKNGVTVSDIMTYNDLDSTDKIYRGQILKVPVTSANKQEQIISSTVSIKAKDSNVKDLVSSLAYNAGYKVIYKGSGTETVTLDLEKVSPLKAIDYVTRMVGLSYLKDGNTILIASSAELNSTFVDSLVLTKFSFKYITYDELLNQASALGLADIKKVSQTNNGRDVWISAYPKEMAKLAELVEILDAPENISVGSNSIANAFTPIELDYITAADFSSLLANLGLHQGITMNPYPNTLFVYVSGRQLTDIMTIKRVVDTDKAVVEGGTTDGSTDSGSTDSGTSTLPGIGDLIGGGTTNDTPTTAPGADDNNTNTQEPAEEAKVLEKIEFVNLDKATVESYIRGYKEIKGDPVFYGHDRMTKATWMYGTASDVEIAKEFIRIIDESIPSASSTVHTYTAINCSAETLMERLAAVVDQSAVNFTQFEYSNVTNSIIIYCDEATWNSQVADLLDQLDTVHTGETTWIPVKGESAPTAEKAEAAISTKLTAMKRLYPEVFDGVEYEFVTIKENEGTVNAEGIVSGASYRAVLYAKATSDRVSRMQILLKAMDEVK